MESFAFQEGNVYKQTIDQKGSFAWKVSNISRKLETYQAPTHVSVVLILVVCQDCDCLCNWERDFCLTFSLHFT